ncbi:MAG: hypothetical protein ACKVQB_06880 [Bacteroidia bacterium]
MEKLIQNRVILFLILISAFPGLGQEVKPSIWEIEFSRDNLAKNDTVTIYFIGKIPEHQGVYSTKFKCDYGPKQTRIIYSNLGKGFVIVDSAISIGDSLVFDEIFECSLRKFKGIATIKQVIRMKDVNAEIKGKLEYQTCTDAMCLPYTLYFETKGTKVVKVENVK